MNASPNRSSYCDVESVFPRSRDSLNALRASGPHQANGERSARRGRRILIGAGRRVSQKRLEINGGAVQISDEHVTCFLGLVATAALTAAPAAQGAAPPAKPTIILVHGAFEDGSACT
jgi:hypothetical protein